MNALDLALTAYSPDELDDAVEIVAAAFAAAGVPRGHPVRVAVASVLIRAVEGRLETERAAGRTAQVIPFPMQPVRTHPPAATDATSPAGGIDRKDFDMALQDLIVAKARMALAAAESHRTITREGQDKAGQQIGEYWRAHRGAIIVAERLAGIPAPTKGAFNRKVTAIGKAWLTSDLEMFTALRAGVEADAARLGVASPVRPELKR